MKRALRFVQGLLFAGLLLAFPSAEAAVKIVGDATDYVTITNAIASAGISDVIRVSTGTYIEVFNIYDQLGLTIEGGYNDDCTVKLAGAASHLQAVPPFFGMVIDIENSTVRLNDLDISGGQPFGGYPLFGGGLHIRDGSIVHLAQCRVHDNRASGYGGGIYVTNSYLAVTNVFVYSNFAGRSTSGTLIEGQGGGLAMQSAEVILSGCTSKWNEAELMGGGIFVGGRSRCALSGEATDILSNIASNGGGIAVTEASMLIVSNGADVCDNEAILHGGGLLLDDRSTGVMYGAATFIGNNAYTLGANVAGHNGGGVAAMRNSRFEIRSGSSVAHNRGEFGGGVYLSNSVCYVNDGNIGYRYNLIHTNYASQLGGGIFLEYASQLVLTNESVVQGNVSFSGGGGINGQWNCAIEMHDSDVRLNRCRWYGGAGICLWRSSITSRYCNINNNESTMEQGGGVYGSWSVGYFDDTRIVSNSAGSLGGGVFWVGTNTPLRIEGGLGEISHNTAGIHGGGLFASAPVELASFSFSHNSASNHGGAIAVSNGTIALNDVSVDNNVAGLAATGNGGGVYAESGSRVTVTRGLASAEYRRNTASQRGGGIFLDSSRLIVTGEVLFAENRAGADGGGAYAVNSYVQLSGGVSYGDADTNNANLSGMVGGGLATLDSTVSLSRVIFQYNTASNFSGGADFSYGAVSGTNVQFIGNRALTLDAGGLYGFFCEGNFRSLILSNNAAFYDGGGCYWLGRPLRLYSCAAVSNSAGQDGGGLVIAGATNYLREVLAVGNQAWRHGGGLQVDSSAQVYGTNIYLYRNMADRNLDRQGDGGGLKVVNGARVYLCGTSGAVRIWGNLASQGGGVAVSNGYLSLSGQVGVMSNQAAGDGGGIYINVGTAEVVNAYFVRNVAASNGGGWRLQPNTSVTLRNCLLAENAVGITGFGGGLDNNLGDANLISCTVISNVNGGVECVEVSSLTMSGCIVWGHYYDEITSGYTVQYSCIETTYPGVGNFTNYPKLYPENYHLTAYSPCRDMGWAASGEVDVDGEPRSGNVDVGFDEFFDTDSDSLPDVVETYTYTWVSEIDTGSDPEDADTDDDGLSDGEEWMADTDPNEASSALKMIGANLSGVGAYLMTWTGGVNSIQYLEVCRNFADATNPNWQIYSTYNPPTESPGFQSIAFQTNSIYRLRAMRPGY